MTIYYCRYRVPDGSIFTRHCKMPAKPSGVCAFHQPEAIARREAKREAKVAAQHARFRHNSDVHEARQHVVEEAMKALEVYELPITVAVACRRLAKLLKKGPTT